VHRRSHGHPPHREGLRELRPRVRLEAPVGTGQRRALRVERSVLLQGRAVLALDRGADHADARQRRRARAARCTRAKATSSRSGARA
jgi:hypothetical protein